MPSPKGSRDVVPEAAERAAARVIAQALRHRAEQIKDGSMGSVQTETPNQIANRALTKALPALEKHFAERLKEVEHQREEWIARTRLYCDMYETAVVRAKKAEAALAERDRQVREGLDGIAAALDEHYHGGEEERIEHVEHAISTARDLLTQPSSDPPQQDREVAGFLKLKERLLGDDAARAFFRAVNGIVPEPNADELEDTRFGLAAAWNFATGHESFALTQPEADPEVPREPSRAHLLKVREKPETNERRYRCTACDTEFMVPLDDSALPPERECDGCNRFLRTELLSELGGEELQRAIRRDLHSEGDEQTGLAGPLGEAIADASGSYSLEFTTPEEVAEGICNWLSRRGPDCRPTPELLGEEK